MVLPKTVYKMIEDVVGPEYVTENPAMLAAYHRGMFPTELPAAVVMPETTEEVQALVKICNRYKIRYSCFVTMFATCPEPDMILFDLKRMNRLIEINEKDMYAIVEPAVTKTALTFECFKRGLQYVPASVVGSAVAAAISNIGYTGHGFTANRYSDCNRSLLGFEWVLPTGDILRTGSLGTGAGWFCQTGPGPSLDGLLSKGSMGIVTKVAIQLFPWEGPRVLPVEGATPNYKINFPEDKFKILHFKMPNMEKLGDALYEICKAEVGTSIFKTMNFAFVIEGCTTMEEFWEKYTSGFFQRETSRLITVWLQAWSREDLEYQEKVVREIIAEMGGEEAPKGVYEGMTYEAIDGILLGIPSCRSQRTSGFLNAACGVDSVDTMVKWEKGIPDIRKEFIEKGLILEATDTYWIVPAEYGHMACNENLFFGDTTIPGVSEAMMAYHLKADERNLREKFPDTMFRFGLGLIKAGDEEAKRLGPLYSNFHLWQMKVKKALDPNLVSNPKAYGIPE